MAVNQVVLTFIDPLSEETVVHAKTVQLADVKTSRRDTAYRDIYADVYSPVTDAAAALAVSVPTYNVAVEVQTDG